MKNKSSGMKWSRSERGAYENSSSVYTVQACPTFQSQRARVYKCSN